jgi:hypothetical protein
LRIGIAVCVHENATSAFGLALFQRPMLRIGYYHDLCQAPGEPADRMEILIALERHGDVKSARTGRLDIRR